MELCVGVETDNEVEVFDLTGHTANYIPQAYRSGA